MSQHGLASTLPRNHRAWIVAGACFVVSMGCGRIAADELESADRYVTGTVVDAHGQAVGGVRLYLTLVEDERIRVWDNSAEDGSFRLGAVRWDREYFIDTEDLDDARRTGGPRVHLQTPADRGVEGLPVLYTGSRLPTFEGSVLDESGQPVDSVRIGLYYGWDEDPSGYAVTDTDGKFFLESVRGRVGRPGLLSFEHPDLVTRMIELDSIPLGAVHASMERQRPVAVFVRNGWTGEPVPSFEISAERPSQGSERIESPDGMFVREHYDEFGVVGIRAPGMGCTSVNLAEYLDEHHQPSKDVVANLYPEVVVTGTVVDSEGWPVADAFVYPDPTERMVHMLQVKTGASGRFRTSGISADTTKMWAWKEGQIKAQAKLSANPGDQKELRFQIGRSGAVDILVTLNGKELDERLFRARPVRGVADVEEEALNGQSLTHVVWRRLPLGSVDFEVEASSEENSPSAPHYRRVITVNVIHDSTVQQRINLTESDRMPLPPELPKTLKLATSWRSNSPGND